MWLVICTTSDGELVSCHIGHDRSEANRIMTSEIRRYSGSTLYHNVNYKIGYGVVRNECYSWFWNITKIDTKEKEIA